MNFADAILDGDVRENLLGDICEYLTGNNVKATKQYQEWLTHSYKMRNEVIHKLILYATEKEAIKAFEVTIKLMNYINDLLIKSR